MEDKSHPQVANTIFSRFGIAVKKHSTKQALNLIGTVDHSKIKCNMFPYETFKFLPNSLQETSSSLNPDMGTENLV